MLWLDEKQTVKGDQISLVADPFELVAPGLIEAQSDGRQLFIRAVLRFPHFPQRLGLQDAMPVEFTAIEQELARNRPISAAEEDRPPAPAGLNRSNPTVGLMVLEE